MALPKPSTPVKRGAEKSGSEEPLPEGLPEQEPSRLLKDFLEKVAPRINLPRVSWAILESFSNIDVKAEKVAQALRSNPYYEDQFFRVIASMSKRETQPSLESAIVLLGMQNTRNLVVALQLVRTASKAHPEWSKEGKLMMTPSDVLQYALQTEAVFIDKKTDYVDTAYAAGVLFDAMIQIMIHVGDGDKKVREYIDNIYKHSLRTAQISMEIVKTMPDFSFKKFAFSAGLIHDIGKAAMAILQPSYMNFQEECVKREIPRAIRILCERQKYGTDHAAIGALVCSSFKIFKGVDRAILFHHEPYLLKSVDKNLFQLSSLICLATNMASNFKKTDKADDPVFALWKTLEIKDFMVEPKQMIAAAAKVTI